MTFWQFCNDSPVVCIIAIVTIGAAIEAIVWGKR
jgi:hypothetical protein